MTTFSRSTPKTMLGAAVLTLGLLVGGLGIRVQPAGAQPFQLPDASPPPAPSAPAVAPPTVRLTIDFTGIRGRGTVTSQPSGINCTEVDIDSTSYRGRLVGTCAADFIPGTVVTLTASPSDGSTFDNWEGSLCGTNRTCPIVMTHDIVATANFQPTTHRLRVRVTGNGTVTSAPSGLSCPGDCNGFFAEGQTVTLTAQPAAGFTFTGWSGECSGSAPACTVSVPGNDNTLVGAAFQPEKLLAVTKTGTGSGTVQSAPAGIDCGADCGHSYEHGTSVTLSATPANGMAFLGWTGACTGTATTCTVTIDADRAVTARFECVSVCLAATPRPEIVAAPGRLPQW